MSWVQRQYIYDSQEHRRARLQARKEGLWRGLRDYMLKKSDSSISELSVRHKVFRRIVPKGASYVVGGVGLMHFGLLKDVLSYFRGTEELPRRVPLAGDEDIRD
ncbi:hypothetical protein BC939DRAFT_472317 [Gamsiella multidivaricata]|uniref:uncharacterized protein n=1 Tax=Gamsiella multidivaricata TaxID=101098 RepID=UPI00221FE529|nr:uncharacterized protein BC939DRAFT_472317 [Gamsiella multidivaricata]KAI7832732.1 hypothetical protein BC939DRAFT_472317 [Gamsiella multidivaricata]